MTPFKMVFKNISFPWDHLNEAGKLEFLTRLIFLFLFFLSVQIPHNKIKQKIEQKRSILKISNFSEITKYPSGERHL